MTVTTEKKAPTTAAVIRTARQGVVRLNVSTCDGGGNGSGFVIAPGLVATAAHVVDGATSIELEPERGGTVQATVVGSDSDEDLALVRADGSLDARTLRFAPGGDAAIGDDVIALGYPLGLPFTATRGALTGDGREVTVDGTNYTGLFQTDAAVNPGNSGGAIVNSKGQVVGVVVAGGDGTEGIGFGVPASRAKPVLTGWAKGPSPQSLAECASEDPAPPVTEDEPTPTDGGDYGEATGYGFSSPTGNIKCSEVGTELVCATDNDGYTVGLPVGDRAYEGDDTTPYPDGGDALPYGSSWTSSDGEFTCESAEMGVTCTNTAGYGFFINRDSVEEITP